MDSLIIKDAPFIKRLRTFAMVLMGIGVVGSAIVAAMDAGHHFNNVVSGYLVGFFYVAGIAVTAVFFSALQFLVRAGWSASIRRVTEMFAGFTPWVALFALPIVIAVLMHTHVYHWLHPEGDKILDMKAPYLNVAGFIIRLAVYFGAWFLTYRYIVGNSIKQDDMPNDYTPTKKNFKRAAPFLILYALSFTFAAFDLVMSLEPHWYSTIFGLNIFAGNFVAVLSLTAIFTVYLLRGGHINRYVTVEHLHDLGKMMFAFNVFWAYIAFSQYFLIWYANLPEETIFYLKRAGNGWIVIALLLIIVHFIVPFAMLLRQDVKRKARFLVAGGVVLLVAHFIEMAFIIMPVTSPNSIAGFFMAIPFWLLMFGVFLFFVAGQYAKHRIVAINDPYLEESMHLIS